MAIALHQSLTGTPATLLPQCAAKLSYICKLLLSSRVSLFSFLRLCPTWLRTPIWCICCAHSSQRIQRHVMQFPFLFQCLTSSAFVVAFVVTCHRLAVFISRMPQKPQTLVCMNAFLASRTGSPQAPLCVVSSSCFRVGLLSAQRLAWVFVLPSVCLVCPLQTLCCLPTLTSILPARSPLPPSSSRASRSRAACWRRHWPS